ncbi:DUF3253 domain-containing protein [Variovorax sp. LT1R16]|uniref:DUF3253 domain-containing protein n=1 Tax=Variovorax sp. LT1R16 TaxID=3443728 RepID=UPI003F48CA0A
MTDQKIIDAIWTLLDARPASASICPSDVARMLTSDEVAWRALMPEVRRVAAALAADGLLRATRGASTVDAQSAGGPIRLRRQRNG